MAIVLFSGFSAIHSSLRAAAVRYFGMNWPVINSKYSLPVLTDPVEKDLAEYEVKIEKTTPPFAFIMKEVR